MKKIIGKNVVMNSTLGIIFVVLNNLILQNSFEETFVSLAFIYGIATVILNALFLVKFCKK